MIAAERALWSAARYRRFRCFISRSQTPVWERFLAKLRFAPSLCRRPKRSFEKRAFPNRSLGTRGKWESGDTSPHSKSALFHAQQLVVVGLLQLADRLRQVAVRLDDARHLHLPLGALGPQRLQVERQLEDLGQAPRDG